MIIKKEEIKKENIQAFEFESFSINSKKSKEVKNVLFNWVFITSEIIPKIYFRKKKKSNNNLSRLLYS
jgi:hypothetical protein